MKYILGFIELSPLQREVKPFLKEAAWRFNLERQPVRIFTEDFVANNDVFFSLVDFYTSEHQGIEHS